MGSCCGLGLKSLDEFSPRASLRDLLPLLLIGGLVYVGYVYYEWNTQPLIDLSHVNLNGFNPRPNILHF